MWFIGVEVEQEMSAPPPKKNPGSAPWIDFEKYASEQEKPVSGDELGRDKIIATQQQPYTLFQKYYTQHVTSGLVSVLLL